MRGRAAAPGRHLFAAALLAMLAGCTPSPAPMTPPTPAPFATPIIIAHRGASGHRPEHTLAAYDLAIDMGADYIEADLVMTRDRVLVARHENEIGGTTDVAEKFPGRKRDAAIDGGTVSGWFTEDFTLAELRTLRAKERLAHRSHAFDGQFPVPTFDEVLALVRRRERETGRTIGVYPETKHPSYFASIGLPFDDTLLATLARHGYTSRADAVYVQSFETGNLRALRARSSIRLIQLIDDAGQPTDLALAGDPRTFRDLVTPEGLRGIAGYADGVGVNKQLVVPANQAFPGWAGPSALVRDAHAAGLAVHVWTLRSDAPFLAPGYGGDAGAEWRHFAALGVDGMFGDFPDVGVAALRGR